MAVTALEVKTRQILANGRDFGSVGRYTQLDGTAHFAVDPAHPLNGCITDIDLAPHDDDGLVVTRPSNHHGRQHCFLENGSGSVGEPKVRTHLPPAESLAGPTTVQARRS
jgi:hypothetical protein